LIAELKTGRAGPAAQLSAAKLLELLTSTARGRPAHRLLPTQKYAALAWIIDDSAAQYAAQGTRTRLVRHTEMSRMPKVF
jgi:hypothetical protein